MKTAPPTPDSTPFLVGPLARRAALTPERATDLVRNPEQETSWAVLAEAARLAKTPFWNLEPAEPWQPPRRAREASTPLSLQRPLPPLARALGPELLSVCPLGISGHYGLPVEGFARAFEAGVNLMFWEPNYQTMTDFYRRLTREDMRSIHLVAGTFEADGERIRRDVERVLRVLKIERISIFLLFWVQTWDRVAPDVREALFRMKAEGKIETFGLSTHNRVLAIEAMEARWNPVMVRHSVAHRGAETRIFPRATELGTSLITFNNTCYSRLLQEHRGMRPPAAADCYRYTLSMPVRACLSAPATLAQLDENLQVLRDPHLPEERRVEMLRFGTALYEEETTFRKLVRSL
jgi:aryl-alcohol dehydrogenase-like predicted oxidoreductase